MDNWRASVALPLAFVLFVIGFTALAIHRTSGALMRWCGRSARQLTQWALRD
jgi:hypothetical protein